MRMLQTTLIASVTLLFATSASAAELIELRVFPPEVSLLTGKDFQSIVVQAVYSDGITRDVTEKGRMESW